MRYEVIIDPVAVDEIMAAAAFIADQGYPENAARWLDGIEKAIAGLADFPKAHPYAREHDHYPEELR